MTQLIDNPEAQPIECEHCHAVFFDNGKFNDHMLEQHASSNTPSPDSISCPECNTPFPATGFGPARLARHRRAHHGVEPKGAIPRQHKPAEVEPAATLGDIPNPPPVDTITQALIDSLEAVLDRLTALENAIVVMNQNKFISSPPTPGSPQTADWLHDLQERFAIHERRADAHSTTSPTRGVH